MSVESIIAADANARGLDWNSVLSVAQTEGGLQVAPGHYDPDAQGNPGWSYGPFQERSPGALPFASSGPYGPGYSWAWSRVGIDNALDRMVAAGARGQRGAQAIRTIVEGFERPANPAAEEQRALAYYMQRAGSSPPNRAQNISFPIPTPIPGVLIPSDLHIPFLNIPTPGSIAGDAAHTLAAPFEAFYQFLADVWGFLTSERTWLRIGFFVGGGVLIILGLRIALI